MRIVRPESEATIVPRVKRLASLRIVRPESEATLVPRAKRFGIRDSGNRLYCRRVGTYMVKMLRIFTKTRYIWCDVKHFLNSELMGAIELIVVFSLHLD